MPWSQVSSLLPRGSCLHFFFFFFPIAHRVQQSHCSSIFHRVLLTHALALSASQFVHKQKSPRLYTSMHSGGFELTKLTYTRLEDNLIRHRGDRPINYDWQPLLWQPNGGGVGVGVGGWGRREVPPRAPTCLKLNYDPLDRRLQLLATHAEHAHEPLSFFLGHGIRAGGNVA